MGIGGDGVRSAAERAGTRPPPSGRKGAICVWPPGERQAPRGRSVFREPARANQVGQGTTYQGLRADGFQPVLLRRARFRQRRMANVARAGGGMNRRSSIKTPTGGSITLRFPVQAQASS